MILDRIDNTLNGLCPCGAAPRPGSPYCCDDCDPTGWHGPATPMRWRPDPLTPAPDDGLTLLAGPLHRGPYTAHILRRDGTNLVHMRLDDGQRFAGLDVDPSCPDYDPHTVWERLEAQLTNPTLTTRRRETPGGPRVNAPEPTVHVRRHHHSGVEVTLVLRYLDTPSPAHTPTINPAIVVTDPTA